jgi:hypothetical protein
VNIGVSALLVVLGPFLAFAIDLFPVLHLGHVHFDMIRKMQKEGFGHEIKVFRPELWMCIW